MALQAGGRNKTLAAAETVGIGVEAAKAGSLGVDNGEGEGDGEPGGVEEPPLPDWLAGREFWDTVEKQIATFALLRNIGIPMDLS